MVPMDGIGSCLKNKKLNHNDARKDRMASKPVKQDLRKVKDPTKGGKRTKPIKK